MTDETPRLRVPTGARTVAGRREPICRTDARAREWRGRLTVAWAESIAIRGYRRTTVQHLVDLAGISRRVVYEIFDGKEDSFVSIHAALLGSLERCVEEAEEAESQWQHRVAAGLAAALRVAALRPHEAQLLVGDPFGAGPRMGYCHDLLVSLFSPRLAAGRRLTQARLPADLELGLLGGVIGVVSDRVRHRAGGALPGLAPSLTRLLLEPYVGAEEAQRAASQERRPEARRGERE